MKRVEGPTPNGGVYAMAYFQNKKGERVEDMDDAYYITICEFDENNDLICETHGFGLQWVKERKGMR